MCLIAFAHRRHPRYSLVLVANRDEFFDRPTRPADWWPEQQGVLAGQDLRAGGTWLGVASTGRWAAVTNYREGIPQDGARSRGQLPLDFITDRHAPLSYAEGLEPVADRFGGYNLLVGDLSELAYHSNRGGRARLLEPGLYTLSNHLLDTPWPKSEQARFRLQGLLRRDQFSVDEAAQVLGDRTPFDDHLLPFTGVDIDMERMLSPPFIVSEAYGTRSTTVILQDYRGHTVFFEQNYLRGEKQGKPRLFQFDVTAAS